MEPKGICKEKRMATSRAKIPTSIINRCLLFDRDCITGFISEHLCGLVQIYNVWSIKDERSWDQFYDIMFLDPVMTSHFSQFQLLWRHLRSRCSHFQEWWAAFCSSMGQMFDITRNQMSNWRWDNPCAFWDEVYRSNLQTTSSGKVKRTGEHSSLYGSDDLRAMIEPPICWQ